MNNIFFDLDGTLTDPGEGITNSVKYALDKFNIRVADKKELYKYIGPPLYDSFTKYCGMEEGDARLAIKYYREYFCDKGMLENEKYEEIDELLSSLYNKKLFLATAKPEPFAKIILEHFGLTGYFDGIFGSTLDETRVRKEEVIEYALKTTGIDKSDVIMVGDREHDIIGAKKNGIKSAGVLYGYGSREELSGAGADYILETVYDLKNFLIKL